MEDASVIDAELGGDPVAFLAVYDGHSGRGAADFCAANLHKVLASCCPGALKDCPEDALKTGLGQAFVETNSQLAKTASVPAHAGCTAVVCLLRKTPEAAAVEVFCANVGDARAVLRRADSGQVVRLSFDHKASVESEAKRITELGGFIRNDRVNGQIEVSRSIGDQLMKQYLIAEPFVSMTAVPGNGGEQKNCLIVACDGIWDVFSDEQAMEFVLDESRRGASCEQKSQDLVKEALVRGSTDNLTAIVCTF